MTVQHTHHHHRRLRPPVPPKTAPQPGLHAPRVNTIAPAGDAGEFDSPVLRLVYTSLTTPRSVIDVNMATGRRVTKKVTPVLGGFSPSDYTTERLWAAAPDGVKARRRCAMLEGKRHALAGFWTVQQGFNNASLPGWYQSAWAHVAGAMPCGMHGKGALSCAAPLRTAGSGSTTRRHCNTRCWCPPRPPPQVPISLVYRNGLVKLDGSAPMLLSGYGSYEVGAWKLVRVGAGRWAGRLADGRVLMRGAPDGEREAS
jgi:hypothetical protein